MSKILLVFLLSGVTTIICGQSEGWDWHQVDPFFVTSKRPQTSTSTVTQSTTKLPNTPTTSMRPTSNPQPSKEQRKCIRKCPSTSEYNPVCGTDNVSYDNIGKLFCAKTCGIATEKSYDGVCAQQPIVTSTTSTPSSSSVTPNPDCFKRCPKTSEYNPLCGSDNKTYDNCYVFAAVRALPTIAELMGSCAPFLSQWYFRVF